MARINVDPPHLQGLARFYWAKSNEIDNIQRALDRALHVSGWRGSSRWSVESEWRDEKRHLERLSNRSKELAKYLNKKAVDFANVDQQNLNRISFVNRSFPANQRFIHPGCEKENQGKIDRWLRFGDDLQSKVSGVLAVTPLAMEGLQKIALKGMIFKPGSHYARQLNISGPKVLRRITGIKAPHMKYENLEKRFLHVKQTRHAKVANAAKVIQWAGYALIGIQNVYINWRDHGEKGAVRVGTGAAVDTALDITLMRGGAAVGSAVGGFVGAGLGAMVAGPVGAAVGAKVGGIAGNIAGAYLGREASKLIKDTESYEVGVDQIAEGSIARGTLSIGSGMLEVARTQAAKVQQAVVEALDYSRRHSKGMGKITTFVPA